jgi:hypothetical protein
MCVMAGRRLTELPSKNQDKVQEDIAVRGILLVLCSVSSERPDMERVRRNGTANDHRF